MPLNNKKENPNRTGLSYSIELKCGDLDLTRYVIALRIGNSVDAIWPQITMQLSIDAKTIVEEDIYGQTTMVLDIYSSGQTDEISEHQTYFLTYVEGSVTLMNVPYDDKGETDKQVINIAALCTYAVNVMGSFVNYIMDENSDKDNFKSGLFPIDILKETLKISGFTNYEISDQGINNIKIDECIIPPMSLSQCIEYLDNTFLLYSKAALFKYCDKDGKLKVWNLVDIMGSEAIAIVHMLDTDNTPNAKGEDSQRTKIIGKADDKKLYASGTMDSVYHSNANVLTYGYTSVLVQKPLHMLYRYETYDVEDMVDSKIKFHETLKSRKRYYTDTQSTSGDYLASLLGQSFKRMSRLKLQVVRNIPLKTFTNIGKVVEVRMGRAVQYQKYQGKYILDSSDMIFIRTGSNWDAICDIVLFRASQEESESNIG